MKIEHQKIIGENRYGYRFAVGRVGDRWIGYAISLDRDRKPFCLLIMQQISEGNVLGLPRRVDAIRRTAAIAQDSESGYGYGGVDTWYIAPELRAAPGEFRCGRCGELRQCGCGPNCGDIVDPEDMP